MTHHLKTIQSVLGLTDFSEKGLALKGSKGNYIHNTYYVQMSTSSVFNLFTYQ